MKSNLKYAFIGIPLLAVGSYFFLRKPANPVSTESLVAEVKDGPLPVFIHAPGELQARRSEKIKGPDGLRASDIYQVTISNLVPEGTLVKAGEFVASLDRTELDGKIKESQNELDKIVTQLDQAKIDTAIEMRGLCDQLINVRFSMKEKEITLELSKYEPEAIRQQARLDLEKAQRELDQLENKLTLTREKSVAKIEEINTSYRQQELILNRFLALQDQMTVKAPKDGMVIYARDWNGKRGPGSQVSAWDPVIAELPDLSEMMTKAYINEVDISKVMPGQKAKVSIDAFPGKSFPGVVISKANIGEQVRNFDTKVFEVIVVLESIDSLLRPAMTTGIEILVDSVPACRQVSLEAIQVDSVSFVFRKTKSGYVRQEVITGPSNDISICVAAGLEAGDEVSLNAPGEPDQYPFVYLDPSLRQQTNEQLKSELAERMKKQQEIARTIKADAQAQDPSSGGTFIIF